MGWITQKRVEHCTAMLARGAAALAKAGAVCAALFGCASFVLWDVDFESVRDRYERAKAALFGQASLTRRGSLGAEDKGASFEERTENGLLFITGRRSIAAMDYRWCYVRRDGGDHDADRSLQVGQGVIIGGSPLMTWNEFTHEQTALFGLAPAALSAAAKRGCVFE